MQTIDVHELKIDKMRTPIDNTNLDGSASALKTYHLNASKSATITKRRNSSIYLILLSGSFYSLCYAPYVYTIGFHAFCPECGIDSVFIKGTAALTFFHSIVNILVYVLKNKELKKAIFAIFGRVNNVQSSI